MRSVLLVIAPLALGFTPALQRRAFEPSARRAPRVAPPAMNLFDRAVRVAKANANKLIEKMEDPEKVLNQAVEDLQKDLVTVRQSYAEVMATQKRMTSQKEQAETLANEWYSRAQLALGKGDEELAREALSRRQQQEATRESLESQLAIQEESLSKLFQSMTQLESKITEAKAMKDQYIARARTAKTATKVNDMLSSATGTTSMDAFERMKEKVEMLESEAEVAGQLAGAPEASLDEKFKALEAGDSVSDELAKMKAMLPGGDAEVKGALPASEIDDELSKLKSEIAAEGGGAAASEESAPPSKPAA